MLLIVIIKWEWTYQLGTSPPILTECLLLNSSYSIDSGLNCKTTIKWDCELRGDIDVPTK